MDNYWRIVKKAARTVVVLKDKPENILHGKDVNLFNFPAPYLHEGDGGRYITQTQVFSKDPVSGARNVGMHPVWLKHRSVKRNYPDVQSDVPVITFLNELPELVASY